MELPHKVPVLDHGYVALERYCGSDIDVVNAARVSYDKHVTIMKERDRGLINYLMRERHGTPFEMVDFTFQIKCPLAVVREWQRHRIASYNEQSGRYTKLEPEFYLPEVEHCRTLVGKPGHYKYETLPSNIANTAIDILADFYFKAEETYDKLVELGLAKEQARLVNPLGIYTKFYFKTNLRSLFNFISLRSDETAMWEIRQYSLAIEDMIWQVAPTCMEAFNKHGRQTP